MNAWPTLKQWLEFGGIVSLELAILFLAARLIAARCREATLRRCLWQMTLVAMLLTVAIELTGARHLLRIPARAATAPAPVESSRRVLVTIMEPESHASFSPPLKFPAENVLSAPPAPVQLSSPAAWPAFAWGSVAFLLLARLLLALVVTVFVRAVGRRAQVALQERVEDLRKLFHIRRSVTLIESPRAAAPYTFGLWKPVIVLPHNFSSAFTPRQQDAALSHELAHVAGLDSVWRAVSQITCALLWWHPVSWLLRRELNDASELVADESCLKLSDGPTLLAECLLACAQTMKRNGFLPWLRMDGDGFQSSLGRRVAKLLTGPIPKSPVLPVPWYARVVLPLLGAAALGFIAQSIDRRPAGSWRDSLLGVALAANPIPAPNQPETQPAERQGAAAGTPSSPANQTAVTAGRTNGEMVLHTRFFRIDTNNLWQSLSNLTAFSFQEQRGGRGLRRSSETGIDFIDGTEPQNVLPTLKNFASAIGVDLNVPGKAVYYNPRLGIIMVRATPEDLSALEKAFQMLNFSPPQLEIRVKVMEVPVKHARNTLLAFGLTNTPRAAAVSSYTMPADAHRRQGGLPVEDRPSPTVTGILTDAQFRKLIADMEKSGGADLLSAPAVTTQSGRRAQIKVVDIRYVVTDIDYSTNGLPPGAPPEPRPIAEPFEIGPTIDIVPNVLPDGYTIEMTVLPTLREFLGYDPDPLQDVKNLPATGGPNAPAPRQVTPLPRFRLRQVASTARVRAGQTLVLGGGHARAMETSHEPDGSMRTNYVDKELFFFVTPRLIDPAGNALHRDDEPEELGQRSGVPKQPGRVPRNEYE